MPNEETIKITHWRDTEFLDAFRRDLADAYESVVIFSPFLSPNRAGCYYAVLHSLSLRRVPVDVYAKPRHEQPETLRDNFAQVQRALHSAGVRFHTRAAMHEKIGMVDSKVLWHGSLNILSHNDTLESMLRIESSAVVREVMADLDLPTEQREEEAATRPTTEESDEHGGERPACPTCGGPMVFYRSADMWLCANSPSCSGAVAAASPRPEMDVQTFRLELACPLCETPMEVRRGIVLRIVCPQPQCAFELEPRLAKGILRVLRRRGTT